MKGLAASGNTSAGAPLQSVQQSTSVGVISKVLLILEALQNSSAGLSLKSICDTTKINKSTAHRFLRHLEREGYVLRSDLRAYLIGPRLARMLQLAPAGARRCRQPRGRSSWICGDRRKRPKSGNHGSWNGSLCGRDGKHARVSIGLRIGTRRSLHVTALGKVLTVFDHASEYERTLGGIVFQRATPKTISNMIQLCAELDKVRRQGFAVDNEEALLGCRCISAPILNNEKIAIGALSVSGPVTRVTPSRVPVLAREVKAAAQAVSVGMGFSHRGQALKSWALIEIQE